VNTIIPLRPETGLEKASLLTTGADLTDSLAQSMEVVRREIIRASQVSTEEEAPPPAYEEYCDQLERVCHEMAVHKSEIQTSMSQVSGRMWD